MNQRVSRPCVLVICRGFPPAYLFGGPVRSVGNLTAALEDDFDFWVLTSACDAGQATIMDGVIPDTWQRRGRVNVWYSRALTPPDIVRRVMEVDPDVIYLNSLFDVRFSLVPLLINMVIGRHPILLAPRGELSKGALELKSTKKRAFIRLFRMLGIHRKVRWHVSTDREANDVSARFGRVPIEVAAPVPTRHHAPLSLKSNKGVTKLVFLGRIAPKKNLIGLLRAVALVDAPLELTVAGPIEDRLYWSQCERIIATLPQHVKVRCIGPVAAADVFEEFSKHDLFVFPTLGENYGHVVLEALTAGTPVIVGRDSPWEVIEQEGAGWTCDPTDVTQIALLIRDYSLMSPEETCAMRRAARQLGNRIGSEHSAIDGNREMLLSTMGGYRSRTLPGFRAYAESRSNEPRRLRVALVMRRAFPGQFSVERAFSTLLEVMPSDIDARIVRVPFRSSGILRRLGNVAFVATLRSDVIHITGDITYCALGARGGRTVLTILDFVSSRRMSGVRWSLLLLLWYKLPLRRAASATAISGFTREQITTYVPDVAARVVVLPIPATIPESGESSAPRFDKLPFTLLQVGTAPHKNLSRVIVAISGLPVELRIVGKLNEEQTQQLIAAGVRYSAVSDLSDSEVLDEYRRADALLFVSTYEGFGLPILEAQAVRLPVITSSCPPMSEVAGGGAVLVDASDCEAISDAIRRLIEDSSLRENIVKAGLKNLRRYSAPEIAKQYADLYRAVRAEG